MPQNDQISPEISIFVHIGPGLASSFGALLSVGGLVGGCGARALSRKTPIYFIILMTKMIKPKLALLKTRPLQNLKHSADEPRKPSKEAVGKLLSLSFVRSL